MVFGHFLLALFCRQPLIHLHQLRHALAFGVELAPETVSLHDGTVVCLMSLAEFGRHREFIVEVGKGAIRIERTSVKDSLCGFLYLCFLFGGGIAPRKIIIYHFFRISVVAFYSSAYCSHLCHVNIRCQYSKMINSSIRNNLNCVT